MSDNAPAKAVTVWPWRYQVIGLHSNTMQSQCYPGNANGNKFFVVLSEL